jgi:hypothetical protein
LKTTPEFADLPPDERATLYAKTALDQSIAQALKELDPEACFVALVLAAVTLLEDVPLADREAFIREALAVASDGGWN